MILSKENITQVIPHRAPFIMVDSLESASDTLMKTSFLVEASNVLCEDGCFSFPGLIENIAQSCAAGLGYVSQKEGEAAKVGYIGAISKLKTHSRAKVGELVQTKIEVLQEFEGIVLVKGSNFVNDTLLVECEMKIVIAG